MDLMEKDFPEKRWFEMSIQWLRMVERRDFYQRLVEFCAMVLSSEVCALFVKTTQIDDGAPRVCLVAGKLPPDHPKGQRMDPSEVGKEPKEHSYRITEEGREYDGVTGKIATTGEPVYISGFDRISQIKGHVGRWDKYVWQGEAESRFTTGSIKYFTEPHSARAPR